MTRMSLAIALAFSGAVALGAAQETKVETETQVKVEHGRNVKLTGCLEPSVNGDGYTLMNVRGSNAAETTTYILVGGDQDHLRRNAGRLVQVKGKIADADHGQVELKSKTKVDRDPGDERERRSETTIKGTALEGLPFLGVKSIKRIGDSCTVGTTGR